MAKLSSIEKNSNRLKLINKFSNRRKLLKDKIMKKDLSIEDRLKNVHKDVNMGKKVAFSINRHTYDIFPPHVLKMIQVSYLKITGQVLRFVHF